LANKVEKEATISELVEKFRRAQTLALADYRGLNVAQMTDLRRRARELNLDLKVIKNTLAARAAKEAGIGALAEHLKGPTAVAISYDDPAAAAKMLVDFARTARQLEIKGGFAAGQSLTAAEVRVLATLPGREVLLAQVLAAMQAPLSSMASVLAAPMRAFATAVDELRKQREAAAD
jgi:large subunit ribosomal protein L10